MKVSVNWNVGNFDVTAETEVSEALLQTFVEKGALQILQRQSEIDRVLGVMVKDGDKWVAQKGLDGQRLKRNAVDYNEKIADALANALTSVKIDENRKQEFSVLVTEYTPDGGKALKFASEKSLLTERLNGGATLASIATKVGFSGDTGAAPDFTPEFLRSVKSYLDAIRKAGI